MKIALVNYRYFVSGGPERYLFNIKELLERQGHEIVVFTIKNSRNEASPFDKYFMDSIGDDVYFEDSKKSLSKVLKSFTRMFYSCEAKRKFTQLLRDTRPDLVYIIQYHNKISPSVVFAARSLGIPVVHRISDMQYMCPNALFYAPNRGICEDCLHGKRLSCIKQKCVLNSRIYSAIKAAAKLFHDIIGVHKKIDAFVVPAKFTLEHLQEFGIPAQKLHHIPTFFNLKENDPAVNYQPFALYIGRIVQSKGLSTLVEAFADTDMHLKIIGRCNDNYIDRLKQSIANRKHSIEFLGEMKFGQIKEYLQSCMFTIVPSEWYDNFPNVVLESFAFKKPVIATNIGSLPELVEDGVTGRLFNYKDANHLRTIAENLFSDVESVKNMGDNAFARVQSVYSPTTHYQSLINLFNSLVRPSNN